VRKELLNPFTTSTDPVISSPRAATRKAACGLAAEGRRGREANRRPAGRHTAAPAPVNVRASVARA